MQIRFIALAFAFASTPAWAIYKCTVNGTVAFQEQPCADAKTQAQIRTQYEAEKIGSEPAVKSATLEEKASALETERLRHETEYALRDKRAQLTNFRAQCDAEVRAIAARRGGFNDNIAGAMRGQAEATAAAAHATQCSNQAKTLEDEVNDLRRQCTAQKCKPI